MVWLTALATAATLSGLPAVSDAVASAEVQDAAYRVAEVTLGSDDVPVRLEGGVMYPVQAGEEVIGAVYLGHGTLSYFPPSSVEAHALRAQTQKAELAVPFERAVLRMSPEVWKTLSTEALQGDASAPEEARRLWTQRASVWSSPSVRDEIDLDLLSTESLLPANPPRRFQWIEAVSGAESVAWLHDPEAPEEESVLRADAGGLHRLGQFHSAAERAGYPPILRANEKHPHSTVTRVRAQVDATRDSLKIDAEVDVRAERERTTWVEIPLVDREPRWVASSNGTLSVERVTVHEDAVEYVHRSDRLLVRLPTALERGDRVTLHVQAVGDLVWPFPSGAGFATLPGPAWLPGLPAPDAELTLDVCAPETHTLVVSGRVKRRWKKPRRAQQCVRTRAPAHDAALVAARLVCKTRTRRGLPRVRACTTEAHKYAIKSTLDVSLDALAFFEKLFGEYPGRQLTVVELPQSAGSMAPPQVAMVTGEAFLTTAERKRLLAGSPLLRADYLAHEIAHQWWGHAVIPKTYHDRWLQESTAAYASALFVEEYAGARQFLQRRQQWTEQVLRQPDAGPLWLGNRLGEAYAPVVQAKGPWVLHMLRYTLGDRDFQRCARAFLSLTSGRAASTEDFQAVCEKVHETSLNWFFEAWVKGTGVPVIHYSYEIEPSPSDSKRWDISGTIRKEGLAFPIEVPVVIHYPGDRHQRVMVPVSGTGGPFRFTGLPDEPSKITVDSDAVLARSISGGVP